MINKYYKMCGIWALFEKNNMHKNYEQHLYSSFMNIKNRGPDRSVFNELSDPINIKLGFHRLSIMDISSKGDQPFKFDDGKRTVYLICNGEIYNYLELIEKYQLTPVSGSDCEVIILLYKKFKDINLISKELTGEYAFIICDIHNETGDYTTYLVNDRFGIRPMFVLEDEYNIMISSELKGFPLNFMNNYKVSRFVPRHYCTLIKNNNIIGELQYSKYYDIDNIHQTVFDLEEAKKKVKTSFEKAVNSMIESDREIGCLLSGGLDSSLVSSCASKILKQYGRKLRTFSIGLPGATDEKYAKMVAEYIGSEHIHIMVDELDFLDAVPKVISMIESYDITTVRASTGQYLISKWISENTNIKVLFCGDGSDELTAGYLYFHKAPNPQELDIECKRLLNDIHLYDGLRADRCIAGHGIEARFPFLNHHFVETYLSVDSTLRMPTEGSEKWLLRKAFENSDYLPGEVLNRTKCAFSDSVSKIEKSWYQILQESVDRRYSDEFLKKAVEIFPHLTPYTKESFCIRELFCKIFGFGDVNNILKYFWLPKWCGDALDPSARTLNIKVQ